ncbi:MAG: flagellar biosynthetic protein FliR [bacterium]
MLAVKFLLGSFSEFLVVLMRVTGIFVLAPIFSSQQIPFKFRGSIALIIALVAFPPLAAKGVLPSPETFPQIVKVGISEIIIGTLIGFMAELIITLFQISGQFYSIQMGFGIINVFDPLAQSSVPIISQFKNLLMIIVFLSIEAHHHLLDAVFKSYEMLPTIYGSNFNVMAAILIKQFDKIFKLGFLIGLPLIGIVFLMTLTLGLLSKLAPQMNVMVVGFALKVMVGILTFVYLVPAFLRVAVQLFGGIYRDLYRLMGAM